MLRISQVDETCHIRHQEPSHISERSCFMRSHWPKRRRSLAATACVTACVGLLTRYYCLPLNCFRHMGSGDFGQSSNEPPVWGSVWRSFVHEPWLVRPQHVGGVAAIHEPVASPVRSGGAQFYELNHRDSNGASEASTVAPGISNKKLLGWRPSPYPGRLGLC